MSDAPNDETQGTLNKAKSAFAIDVLKYLNELAEQNTTTSVTIDPLALKVFVDLAFEQGIVPCRERERGVHIIWFISFFVLILTVLSLSLS